MNSEAITTRKAKRVYMLAACPFCGRTDSAKILPAAVILDNSDLLSEFGVICSAKLNGCGSSSGIRSTKKKAAALWNTRFI
jgi:hypothetical protein